MLANKTAIPFHKFVCPNCHNIPQGQQWMNASETTRKDSDNINFIIVKNTISIFYIFLLLSSYI